MNFCSKNNTNLPAEDHFVNHPPMAHWSAEGRLPLVIERLK